MWRQTQYQKARSKMVGGPSSSGITESNPTNLLNRLTEIRRVIEECLNDYAEQENDVRRFVTEPIR